MPAFLKTSFSRTIALLAIMIAGCSDPLDTPQDAAEARAHIQSLMDIMQANSVNRRQINWAEFRSAVLAAAGDPKSTRDTFEAIQLALDLLGDGRSTYASSPSYNVTIRSSGITCTAVLPAALTAPADVGYVRVQGYSGSGQAAADAYATTLNATIRGQGAKNPIGWIVDLRGNTTGNMWPAIAGLGPILGTGTLGYFLDPDGAAFAWEYRDGKAILNGQTQQTITDPYVPSTTMPNVAVLLDGRVSGYGEGVAMALVGRPNTRFFGSPTCGIATATTAFGVGGAVLSLAVTRMADRTKAVHDSIRPDVTTSPGELLDRAVDWLRSPTTQQRR